MPQIRFFNYFTRNGRAHPASLSRRGSSMSLCHPNSPLLEFMVKFSAWPAFSGNSRRAWIRLHEIFTFLLSAPNFRGSWPRSLNYAHGQLQHRAAVTSKSINSALKYVALSRRLCSNGAVQRYPGKSRLGCCPTTGQMSNSR